MKGFVEHIINEYDLFKRNLSRDLLHIEVPLMKDKFSEWLNDNEYSEGTKKSYISFLKSMDDNLFLYEDDFYEGLSTIVYSKDMDGLEKHFQYYENILKREKEDSTTQKSPIYPTKHIQDWISGFRAYHRFIKDVLTKAKIENQDVQYKPNGILPLQEQYIKWLTKSRAESTANQYVSYIKHVDQVFFAKIYKSDPFFDIIKLLKEKPNISLAIVESLAQNLCNETLQAKVLPDINAHSLDDYKTAVRSYVEFMTEIITEYIDENSTDENITANTTQSDEYVFEKDTKTIEGHDSLIKNLKFRLSTQNRLSQSKKVFFPIGLIRKLFVIKNKYYDKDEYFDQWLEGSVNNIYLLSETKSYTFDQVDKLEITSDNRVNAIMKNGETISLYSKTSENGQEPFMADSLQNIHIDHTPLIGQLLDDNELNLPTLVKLTKDIKAYCDEHHIKIAETKHSVIYNGVIEMYSDEDIMNILSNVKKDMDFIRSHSHLEFMESKENLRKKS